jgi:hypothetical protein
MFENLLKIDPDIEEIKFGKNLKIFFEKSVKEMEALVVKIEAVKDL